MVMKVSGYAPQALTHAYAYSFTQRPEQQQFHQVPHLMRRPERRCIHPAVPTVYVTGGAQGSHALNMAVEAALPDLLGVCQVIHQCGEGPDGSGEDLESLQAARAALPPHLQERYRVQAFVGDEIADVYALASLVVGRAGAGTVNELANLGKPSILVPLPGAKEQAANAHALEAGGREHYYRAGGTYPAEPDDRHYRPGRAAGKAGKHGQGRAQAIHRGRG